MYFKRDSKLKQIFWPISFGLLLLQLKSNIELGKEGGFHFPSLCIQQQDLYSLKCLGFASKYYQPPQTKQLKNHFPKTKKKPTQKTNKKKSAAKL